MIGMSASGDPIGMNVVFVYFFFPAGILAAVLLGVAQWLILRRFVPGSGWWVPATLGGGILALGLTVAVVFTIGTRSRTAVDAAITLFPLIGGVATGTMHWLILRRKVAWAGWWVVLNVLVWVVGLVGGVFLPLILEAELYETIFEGAGYYLFLVMPLLAIALGLAPLTWLRKR